MLMEEMIKIPLKESLTLLHLDSQILPVAVYFSQRTDANSSTLPSSSVNSWLV